MKIFMCNVLLFTLMVFLNSVQSMNQQPVQHEIRTLEHEYVLRGGTKVYTYQNRHYIRDVNNNDPQIFSIGDQILRGRDLVAVAKRDQYGINFYEYNKAGNQLEKAILENDDTVLRDSTTLIAVFIHPIGFCPLHELTAGSSLSDHLQFSNEYMKQEAIHFDKRILSHDYLLPVGTRVYSYDNRHYIREVGNNTPQTIKKGDQILRNGNPVARAERRMLGTNFYDLGNQKQRTKLEEYDTVLRDKKLVAVNIVGEGLRALREITPIYLTPGSSSTVHPN